MKRPASDRAQRGLTLLELAVVLAVLAVLSALALPNMAARLRAERLQAAAEMLAADIADARHEAARRGQTLHIEGHVEGRIEGRAGESSGAAWCWTVATAPGCPCGSEATTPASAAASPTSPAACRLKRVAAGDHPGVALVQAQPVQVQADGQANPVLAAVLAAGDRQLQVQVSRFGRARVCDPAGTSARLPRC
ncbi:MAG: prepilin-type N-terminal cleavage/methylation domain-containing protein [Rubrivivax sp.]|nr:prepilin-type N-terminal cleavage/methylation domain-containing protein [Rubrivivax sp.]